MSKQLFTPDDYAPLVTASGAIKLADSQVAPLVAAARGYATINSDEGAKLVAKKGNQAQSRKNLYRLKKVVEVVGEFMEIPWYSAANTLAGDSDAPSTIQYRPATPLPNGDGKMAKYQMLLGHSSPIDMHPAMSKDLIKGARKYLFTEGVLKADSALTAQLLAAGITPDELAIPADPSTARVVLATLYGRIPAADRTPVLALIGVTTWHQNPEWNVLNLGGSDTLVAFDGDLRENPNVWAQADQLWKFLADKKNARPVLVDLGGAEAANMIAASGWPAEKKLGLDDFLSHVGGWNELNHLLVDHLPPAPERKHSEVRVGTCIVSADGTSVLRYTRNDSGALEMGAPTYSWERIVDLGGRVTQISDSRQLADISMRSGYLRPDMVVRGGRPGSCSIEVSWADPQTGKILSEEITGPLSILNYTPTEWDRKGAHIPIDVLLHPEWPPTHKNGQGWAQAIKAHRAEDTEKYEGWDTMGWVPTASGNPVFIVGNQTLGSSPADERENTPGVTEDVMPGASLYGVNDTYWQFVDADNLDGYKAQVRHDIELVLDRFVFNSPWKDRAFGPILLATALRPTLPAPTSLNVFISGAPGTGKTYGASFCMGFWGAYPGAWTVHNMPGQATDTPAAREHSVARTPLFVTDDLAPSTSRLTSERTEANIDESIRAGFNGAGKRRGTAEGDQRARALPRAVQMFTAENERETLSIRQRVVSLRLNSKEDTDKDLSEQLEKLTRDPSNPLARVTAAMIRVWANHDLAGLRFSGFSSTKPPAEWQTWAEKREFLEHKLAATKEMLQDALDHHYGIDRGTSARRAGMFAELFTTLDFLIALGVWAGMDFDSEPLAKLWGVTKGENGTRTGYKEDMRRMAASDLRNFQQKSNSRNLLEAIGSLLGSGKAHLEHPTKSGMPPIAGRDDADTLNRLAGWSFDPKAGVWVPKGTSIGVLGECVNDEAENGFLVAALSPVEAFSAAKRAYPDLVPHGQGSAASWSQVWTDEGGAMIAPGYETPARGNATHVRVGGVGESEGAKPKRRRLWGIPVSFDAIIGSDDD